MATLRYRLQFNKNTFETQAWAQNQLVCGIDEVGRGCLAGPVVVSAVILHPYAMSRLVKDSKALDALQRQKAYSWIIKNSWYSVAIVHNRTIDKVNIYQATLIAMRRAALQLGAIAPQNPHIFLVDAMPLLLANTQYHNNSVYYFPFGETKSISIAAASIVAKVSRDALMKRMDRYIPGYSFGKHKGYATPLHQESIKQVGPSLIHRVSFLPQNSPLHEELHEEQQTLW